LRESRSLNGRHHAVAGVEAGSLGPGGVDAAEVSPQRACCQHHRAGDLDARRAATDDDEGQPRGTFDRVLRALGFLERGIELAPQMLGVGQCLEAVGRLRPLVVAEVGRLRPAGDDQAVVVEVLPRSRITCLASASTSVTSAISTVVFALRRSDGRSGAAQSLGDRAPAATW
jgi:hypothetical protein